MKRVLIVSAAVAALGLVGVIGGQASFAAAPQTAAAMAGERVGNFQLTDHLRYAHDLYYYKYTPAVVIMTQSNGSALSREAAAELEKLQASYKAKGVVFFMINSNLGQSRDATAAEAKARGYTIPVLMDEQQLVGEQMGVRREAEVYVLNPKTWQVAYRGPLDDRFATASPNAKAAVKTAYAAQAIDALIAGKAVETARVDAKAGAVIAFPERDRAAQFANISYAKVIAPILQEKCVSCHLTGGIGPFALDSYERVKGFAPMIRESVRTKRMPPYFADPHIGQFNNDQGMTDAQTKALVHWIEAGALRGEGADPLLANKDRVAPQWPVALGEPDVIVKIPAFSVPASGIVEYQNQRVDNPFKDDTYLRAISIKPGDRSVLHHVVSNHVADPTRPRTIPGGSVGSYTPGADAQIIAKGMGAPVPGGGKLNFQMHYTTTGKPATDVTEVGFYVLKEKPTYLKRSAVIGDFALSIPAGEARHRESAYMTFPADAEIYTLYPHAHYRGRNVELKMVTPDGKETMLLALPKYDFNWQRDYDPVVPIKIKAGTKIVATWEYDNSANNFANPDPKMNVTWGEQTHEEMMYFRINYRFMDETVEKIRNDLQTALQGSLQLGALDDNLDGLVQASELRGPMIGLKAQFAALDKDGNGGLDKAELSSVNARSLARQVTVEIPDL